MSLQKVKITFVPVNLFLLITRNPKKSAQKYGFSFDFHTFALFLNKIN